MDFSNFTTVVTKIGPGRKVYMKADGTIVKDMYKFVPHVVLGSVIPIESYMTEDESLVVCSNGFMLVKVPTVYAATMDECIKIYEDFVRLHAELEGLHVGLTIYKHSQKTGSYILNGSMSLTRPAMSV